MPPVKKKMYYVYVYIGGKKHYANRPLAGYTKYRWYLFSEEYPDIYTWNEARAIQAMYNDQAPRLEGVYLEAEVEA